MARPRDSAAQPEEPNRRAELLRAAARLFHEQGYEATTIRDIAAAVGMRSGSPFYHFKSKQEMLKAVMLEGLETAHAAMATVSARRLPPRAAFEALVRAHLGTLLEHGGHFIPVLLYEWRSLNAASRADITAIKDSYEAIWQRAIVKLKKAKLIDADARLARLLIFGALNWTAQWYRPGAALNIDAVAAQASAFFLQTAQSK